MLLVVHPDAEREIIEAADWYDQRAEGLGDDLFAAVDAAITTVLDYPIPWPTWPGTEDVEPQIQRYRLGRFRNYAIAYQHFDDAIVVLALVHDRRRPFYWLPRATR